LSNAGITIVVSTHNVNFAYRVARRAVVFAHGRIIADADIEDVFISDKILEEAGLKKPLLYEAFEYLSDSFMGNNTEQRKPRTIEEFRAFAALMQRSGL